MWIPGHCDITGNELADKATRLAHSSNNSLTTLNFSYQDAKRTITKDIYNQWEKKWIKLSTKLHEIKRVFPRKHHQETGDYHHPSQNRAHSHHPSTSNEERRSFSLHQLWYVFNRQTHPLGMPDLWKGQERCRSVQSALGDTQPWPMQSQVHFRIYLQLKTNK